MIERYIIEQKMRYINQAQGIRYIIELLKSLIGTENLKPFGDKALTGKVDLELLPLSKLWDFFKELSKIQKPIDKIGNNWISLNEMKYAFTKLKVQKHCHQDST